MPTDATNKDKTDKSAPSVASASDDEERQEHAYRLHLRGYSYRAIARELDTSKDTVQRWVKAMQAATAPKRKANRERQLREAVERFREIQHAAWLNHLTHDDAMALNTALACEREIAKLRGLYDLPDENGAGNAVTITISKRGSGGVQIRGRDGQTYGDPDED